MLVKIQIGNIFIFQYKKIIFQFKKYSVIKTGGTAGFPPPLHPRRPLASCPFLAFCLASFLASSRAFCLASWLAYVGASSLAF